MIEEYDGSGDCDGASIGSELLARRYHLMFSWHAVNNAQADGDHEALEELQAEHNELWAEYGELIALTADHGVGCDLWVSPDGHLCEYEDTTED